MKEIFNYSFKNIISISKTYWKQDAKIENFYQGGNAKQAPSPKQFQLSRPDVERVLTWINHNTEAIYNYKRK